MKIRVTNNNQALLRYLVIKARLMRKKYTFLIYLIVCVQMLQGQTQQYFNIVGSPSYNVSCDSSCVMLHTNFPATQRTTQYTTSLIPFAPQNTSGTNLVLSGNDKFSNAIPLGFNFCFFDNVYNECYISDNGVLTFNPVFANSTCFNSTCTPLPYTNSTAADNAIYGLFMDIDLTSAGNIRYQTIGIIPNRKFVVSFNNVQIFGATCSNQTNTYQIILHESDYSIEVQIAQKVLCDNDPNNCRNYSTIGIQNFGATIADTIPGKSASMFTCNQEAFKFTPSGGENYKIDWFNQNNVLIGSNVDSLNFCPPYFNNNQVRSRITFYCPFAVIEDTMHFTQNIPNISNVTLTQPSCTTLANGSILATGSGLNPPFTYSLNNGPYQSNNLFSNLGPGTYIVYVKDAGNCVNSTIVYLVPTSTLSVTIDSIIYPSCPLNNNGYIEVSATGGVPPYSYSWSNGVQGPNLTNLTPNSYAVTVTDSIGCTKVLNVQLPLINIPTIILAQKVKSICGNSNGSITVSAIGLNPPFTFQWFNPSVSGPTLDSIPAGFYQVTVTDSLGCQGTNIFQLQDTLNVISTIDSQSTACGLPNGSASITATNGLGPYTYLWMPSGQTNSTATNLAAGIYTCITTASNGCSSTNVVNIASSLPTQNQISASNANCDTSNGKILLLNVSNATLPITYLWSHAGLGPNQYGLAPGIYWVQTTDSLGCKASDTIHIGADGTPRLEIVSYTPPNCNGDSSGSVTLSGTLGVGPYKYSINGFFNQSIATLTNVPGGTYPIYIKDANGCVNDTVVTFAQPTPILFTFTTDTLVCKKDINATITFQASGGAPPYSYSFNGNNNGPKQQYDNLGEGTYTIVVTDSNTCEKQFTIEVVGPTEPLQASFDVKNVPCYEDSTGAAEAIIVGGWPPYSFVYDNPAYTSLMLTNLDVSLGTIYITDARGCETSARFKVTDNYCCTIVVPNAFTPNNDGLNDKLNLVTRSEFYDFKIIIYNRWGQKVFESADYATSWNGFLQSTPCDMGTYFYYLEYTCAESKQRKKERGDITLIK